MAENQELQKSGEREIPVFTVLKGNSILKNIYLLDKPPSSPSSSTIAGNGAQESENEETLVVGRHPDCNIKLEHPSISRFHIRIHSKPSTRSLSVTDLTSVHGTWVSGKRAEPGVRINLNDGDTLRLGGSSRLYRLQWIPVSRAYDMDYPFVSQLDVDTVDEEIEEPIYQDENSLSTKNVVETLSDNLEGLEMLFSEENLCLSDKGEMETLSNNLEGLEMLFSEENLCVSDKNEVEILSDNLEGLEVLFSDENSLSAKNEENEISSIQLCNLEEEISIPRAFFQSSAFQMEDMETCVITEEERSNLSIWSRRGKPKSVQIETGQSKGKSARSGSTKVVNKVIPEILYKTEPVLENHFTSPEQIFTPDKENCSPCPLLIRSLKKKGEESLKSELFSSMGDDLDEEMFTPDKETMTPNTRLLRSMKNLEEVKHPKTYKSSPLKRAINFNPDEERQHGKVLQEWRSSSSTKSCAILNKEPSPLKATADRVPFRALSVKSSSKAKSKPSSGCKINLNNGGSSNYPMSEEVIHSLEKITWEENKRWIIVVDTSCLLNKKSRKELQLLQGLKGTSLHIPRIVVRELDCMLRHGGFFRRTTEVSAALEWIEDCMGNAKCWVRVQSSGEEGRLVPPTPPASASASPHWLSENNNNGLLQEIVTPTAKDHILEYALSFKRSINNNGHLVILSDDVTLKIKAMAEGVICETAKEFRGSLLNPFSARFLYTGSSPMGPTWSCVDDAVLKERYYPSPSKKLSKSGQGMMKGLKVILQHNSNFRQHTIQLIDKNQILR